jgi:hypothetical protein
MATELSGESELGVQKIPLVESRPSGGISTSQLQATSERTINDILKQETLVSSFTITPDVEVGTRLEAFVVNPKRVHPPGGSSRISFMASLFVFWRGMITLRLVFTKTILQQMKVAVLFVPGAKIDDPTPTKAEIMMYSHKQIINPTNESEILFDIPFISDRPFLRMEEDTGVIYFILFQPFTASVDPTNVISCDIFASSKTLEMHEFGVIPTLDPLGFSLPNDLMFLLSETSNTPLNVETQTGTVSFESDGGQLVSSPAFFPIGDISWATIGSAIGGANYTTPEVYDPALHKTIWGEPEPGFAGMGRICHIKVSEELIVSMIFHFSNRGVFFRTGSATETNFFFGPMSELSRDFMQYLTLAPALEKRVLELEKLVEQLLARPVNLDQMDIPRVTELRSIFENRSGIVIDFDDIIGFRDSDCQLCGCCCDIGGTCESCGNIRKCGKAVHCCPYCDNGMYESQRVCGCCGCEPQRMYEVDWLFRKEDRVYHPVTVEFLSRQEETSLCACFSTCQACGSDSTCFDSCDCRECYDNPIVTDAEKVARYLGDRLSVPKPGVASLDLGIVISDIRWIYNLMMSCGYIVKRDSSLGNEPNLVVEGGWRQFRYLLEEGDSFSVSLPHHYA